MAVSAGLSMELLDSWNLNPLELDRARTQAAASYFAGSHNHGIPVDPATMGHFLWAVEQGYSKVVPYHTWSHGVDVMHCVYRLLRICVAEAYLGNTERFALLISAVAHDVGHPGLNNAFLVDTSHELALVYNDLSPLEHMHCAKLFEIMGMLGCGICASLSKSQYQEIRTVCVEAILHTDNANHFAMIKETQTFIEMNSEVLQAARELYDDEEPDDFPMTDVVDTFRQPDVRRLLVKLLLHFADMSNPLKPFRICQIWALLHSEECFLQGDSELALGMPVQALNDRDKVNLAQSQIGFIELMVSPLLQVVICVLPPLEPHAEQMILNAKMWYEQWLTEAHHPRSEAELRALAERLQKLENKYRESLRLVTV
eukprot:NODE_6023_length_1712_cov_4.540694.p1 GENE.NODE_6023_length_1712_cov_4.540694~~NODE_6023_length_1712_cov_4.540694.p1  ORF type:complete len:425 (-),score=149.55 NODE_6023_length_1712_cov_4.540694:437-1549(-)